VIHNVGVVRWLYVRTIIGDKKMRRWQKRLQVVHGERRQEFEKAYAAQTCILPSLFTKLKHD